MNDADYNKPDVQKPKNVIKGTAKVKPKGEIHKLADIFLADDVHAVKDYVVKDILIPGLLRTAYDGIMEGLGKLFNISGGSRRNDRSNLPYVSYGKNYDRRDDRRDDRYRDDSRRDYYNFNDVIFDNRGDAEKVLDLMRDALHRYDFVSVFDFYDFANLRTSPADANYGWISLRQVEVRRVRDGYKLTLPRALPRD